VGGGEPERREALQHAGRALALDPQHPGAMRTMIRLLLEPPASLPGDVRRDLDRANLDMVRTASGKGAWTYVAWLAFAPMLLWTGIRSWPLMAAWVVPIALAALISFLGGRMRFADPRLHFASLVVSSVAIGMTTTMLGPFVLLPVLVAVNTIAYLLHSLPAWRVRALLVGAVTLLVPVIGELAGWWPRTTHFTGDALIVRSMLVYLPEGPAFAVLALATTACILVPGIYVMNVRDALLVAERTLHVQSWHLRQLIPAAAQDALAPKAESAAGCPISGSSPSRP
jgi:hypothetical protein